MNSVNTNATMQKVDSNNTSNQTEAKMGPRKVESYKSDNPLKLRIAEYDNLAKNSQIPDYFLQNAYDTEILNTCGYYTTGINDLSK